MALNEMIAQGAQFKMPDPLEQYGRIAQIQQAQNQNALAQYQISSAQRADETNTNFLGALRAAGNDPIKIQQAYINAGKGKDASEYATSLLTQQKARGDILKQQRDNFSSDLLDLSGNPTDEKISFLAKNIATDSNYPPAFQAIAARKFSELLATPFADRSKILSMSGATVAERTTATQNQFTNTKPNFIERTDGNSKWMEDTNPNSVTYRQIQSSNQMQQTPGDIASAQTAANRLDFDKAEAKWKKDNPGFKLQAIEKADGTTEYYAVNEITKVATRITLDGTPLTGVNLPAQTAAIRQKFDQDKLDFERKFPGFTIEKATQADGSEKFKKVDKLTGEATDVMDVSGTPLTGAAKITLSPLATLQKELAAMPKGSPQAKEHQDKILKEITDTSRAQLKLAQDRFAWDKANPNHHIEALNNPDGSQRFVAVNTRTRQAYPITETEISNRTPPNVGAPLVGPAAGVVPTAVPAQTPGGPAMAGQPVPLTSARPYKEPTVSEQNAGYNIGRVLRAATSIQSVIAKDPTALSPKIGEAMASSVGLSGAANVARTGNRQIVYGAQRDVVDALLYLATGAAYNKEQLAAQLDTYMPQYTDKPETVIEKQQRLVELISDAKSRAGKAWTPKMDAAMNVLNIQSAAPGGVDANNPLLSGK